MNDQAIMPAIFDPQSIAIIGASGNETKIGGRPIRYLRMAGYKGHVYPINPTRDEVQGLSAYASLSAVEGSVDLAIVAVPAAQVADAIQACADKGVKAAIIFSAGFSEVGDEGRALQDRIVSIARKGNVRLLGPNCMGAINTGNGAIATFSSGIVDRTPDRGRISLASQSGAIGAHCYVLANARNLGINKWVTAGNQCDLEVSDFLLHMASDPDTDVILCCIEGVNDGRKLTRALDVARANRKPVVVMKLGTSEAGAQAAQSHTASLGGSDAVFDAVLKQYGAYRAKTLDEMFDIAYACLQGGLPTNSSIGIVTVSGGGGIMMADAASELGLDVTPLEPAVQTALREIVPFAGTRNPVDVTAEIISRHELLYPMFELLAEKGGYGSVLTFLSHLGRNPAIIEALKPDLLRIAQVYGKDRALFLSLLYTDAVRADLEEMGFIVFEDPSRAVRAAAALTHFGRSFANQGAAIEPESHTLRAEARANLAPDRSYSEVEARDILAGIGLPFPAQSLATSAEEAAEYAAKIGFPVVMKIVSPDIPHKSEIGGVILDVRDGPATSQAFDTLLDRARAAAPNASLDGVAISPMLSGGTETILGVTCDPAFGPVVMFGLGGIFTEVFKDVSFRLAPFNRAVALSMIDETTGAAILCGARGQPRADIDALADALVTLSIFADQNRALLSSIDINPFKVFEAGKGAAGLDALIITSSGAGHSAPALHTDTPEKETAWRPAPKF
ncbi:acetate--CoA ligase family protein [Pseudooceanicola sp.]|uniref:acetate--CoA ligase family protein n=1 Tax=Pseudooceanicola sp. TaxID=1914328 RepID=UPI00262A9FE9|nr:acetate--CoA ligase family protein [Pseudooceanicola sp.]MDF1857053.1 acetate--CoA ligase family protein [Pseudooceanicola sp.]